MILVAIVTLSEKPVTTGSSQAIGLSDELAKASIRITIDENITDEQIEYLINTIKDCVAKMRQSSPLWKEITNEDN